MHFTYHLDEWLSNSASIPNNLLVRQQLLTYADTNLGKVMVYGMPLPVAPYAQRKERPKLAEVPLLTTFKMDMSSIH